MLLSKALSIQNMQNNTKPKSLNSYPLTGTNLHRFPFIGRQSESNFSGWLNSLEKLCLEGKVVRNSYERSCVQGTNFSDF